MCYSAQVHAEFRKYSRQFGAVMDLKAYVKKFWWQQGKNPLRRPKAPRAMERELLTDGPPELADAIRQWDAYEISQLEREVFKQRRRVADAERTLQQRDTKKAREDVRIGSAKVEQAMTRLAVLKGEPSPLDSRIFPGVLCPVMVKENGQYVVRPMRYQCRMPGWTEAVERKYPGTYNARRDKLEQSWGKVFGYTHGVMLADAFFEHVDRNGEDVILEFRPRGMEQMIVACLWTRTVDQNGEELYSFAAVTDEPPTEVLEAGHDRCIIPLKKESVDTWLAPDSVNLGALYNVLEDRETPYFENRQAA